MTECRALGVNLLLIVDFEFGLIIQMFKMLLFKENGIDCAAFNGASRSISKTKDGKLSFRNKRAEAWWKFREELDPSQEGWQQTHPCAETKSAGCAIRHRLGFFRLG
jgi:hypothetical protein